MACSIRSNRIMLLLQLLTVAFVFSTFVFTAKAETPNSQKAGDLTQNISPTNTDNQIITNSIGIKLKYIKPGQFLMGSHWSRNYMYPDEAPQHVVQLTRPFYLGITEVTQAQWFEVMTTCPWSEKENTAEGDNYPATFVSWDDANEFCRRLSEREKRHYRLPTESEWEYACRSGTDKKINYSGNDDDGLSEYSWYGERSFHGAEGHPHIVGQKKPNLWGLYDMIGNVYEWCYDYFGDAGYPSCRVADPKGPPHGEYRVIRGCSWSSPLSHIRPGGRVKCKPDVRRNYCGFRIALDLTDPNEPRSKVSFDDVPPNKRTAWLQTELAKLRGLLLPSLYEILDERNWIELTRPSDIVPSTRKTTYYKNWMEQIPLEYENLKTPMVVPDELADCTIMDPNTGRIIPFYRFVWSIANFTGKDVMKKTYFMLVGTDFLFSDLRVIKPTGLPYISLAEAVDIAIANPDSKFDRSALGHAIEAITKLQESYRARDGKLMAQALKAFHSAIEQINASAKYIDTQKHSMQRDQIENAGTDITIDLGNDVKMEFVRIPEGHLLLTNRRREDLKRTIRIPKPFYMSKYEVTQDQYMAVTHSNPSRFKGRTRPVETVSYNQAVEFCKKLSNQNGIIVRLPDSYEWDFARHATTETTLPFFDNNLRSEVGNWSWYSRTSGMRTHDVGQKDPNPFGLYDMYGNVWEWCSDYHSSYFDTTSDVPFNSESLERRMLFSGSSRCGPGLSILDRISLELNEAREDAGFRVVMEID